MLGFVNKILTGIIGKKSDKDINAILPILENIKKEYPQVQSLSNDALRHCTFEFKQRINEYLSNINAEIEARNQEVQNNESLSLEAKEQIYNEIDKLQLRKNEALEEVLLEILPKAFAVVKETARRFKENTSISSYCTDLDIELAKTCPHITIENNIATYQNTWMAAGTPITWDMVHYDVQLIGGIALHTGKIAEMSTGEGKTLVSTLPAYLNGLTQQGVHIVTVNDYLAKRDSEWMGTIHNFLGLTVDCIDKHQPNSAARRKAYAADITYGTNNEFGFDYLRDNMVQTPEEMVQRRLHYAMVDEVDSVLIDDARTPLIISGPVERGDEHEFDALKPRIEKLVELQKNLINKLLVEAKKSIAENNKGVEENQGGLALLRAHRGLPKYKALIKFLSETGTKKILNDTENYYLQEQSRRMPQVDKELYFIIDEKNNSVDLTNKGIETITASGEDTSFFVLPVIGTEIANIERNISDPHERVAAKDKLMQEYAIKSERIHTIQQLLKAYTLFEKNTEYIVTDEGAVKIVDEQTGRILEGRRYSDGLHQAIEAKESVTIEAATQTYATVTLQNYFRMYHKLAGMTGTAETEAGEFWTIYKLDVMIIPTNRPISRDDRDDLIYRTEREKFNAVIEEIEKLSAAGRPILVGTTSVDISEKLSRLLQMRKITHQVLNAKHHAREAEIVANAGLAGAVTIATNMAGRGTDIKLGPGVKEAGGLAIIGTERHESRRVDRQLRGRAGRQGDPGSSQFFVSLEDNLMRLFGGDRIVAIMDRMNYKDGEVMQHSMLNTSIERAQKKVEENHFGTRKRLLDYDEVMNAQRKVIYGKRRHALFGERLLTDIYNSFRDICYELVSGYKVGPDFKGFEIEVIRNFSLDTNITDAQFAKEDENKLAEKLFKEVIELYHRKSEIIAENVMPFLINLKQNQPHIQRVIFPFTDGNRAINLIVDLDKAIESKGKEVVTALEKTVSLALIDEAWKDHLRQMDDLRQAVQNAVYEQKDPLLIYKKEAFTLFSNLLAEVNHEISMFLFRAGIAVPNNTEAPELSEAKIQAPKPNKAITTNKISENEETENDPKNQRKQAELASNETKEKIKQEPIIRETPKIGRNEPCYCGSGKKYKNCHGKDEF